MCRAAVRQDSGGTQPARGPLSGGAFLHVPRVLGLSVDALRRAGLTRSCSIKGPIPSVSACIRLLLGVLRDCFLYFVQS